ncbi:DNA-binding response OmpR family regulator [Rhizobium sp. BK181]|uniref:response regulator n=1 Tax=Rhizobium sp. BK181 TaxID=2587072 RepID=UPI00161E6F52|nr:response regulator [Rhizobium sp. BK181]MBB3318281.1 DNA-binding response OmpR family regulator [Rhizobium sp. BK181]
MRDPKREKPQGRTAVLVVEDEFFIADDLRRVLVDAGFEVLGPASSVQDALDLLEAARPHAAVLDVHLGRENVTPVALELAKLNVPFVIATASPAQELAPFPILANAVNLGKPTDGSQMIDAIRKLVATS